MSLFTDPAGFDSGCQSLEVGGLGQIRQIIFMFARGPAFPDQPDFLAGQVLLTYQADPLGLSVSHAHPHGGKGSAQASLASAPPLCMGQHLLCRQGIGLTRAAPRTPRPCRGVPRPQSSSPAGTGARRQALGPRPKPESRKPGSDSWPSQSAPPRATRDPSSPGRFNDAGYHGREAPDAGSWAGCPSARLERAGRTRKAGTCAVGPDITAASKNGASHVSAGLPTTQSHPVPLEPPCPDDLANSLGRRQSQGFAKVVLGAPFTHICSGPILKHQYR